MGRSTQKKWNQTMTSIKLRELDINMKKREEHLEEQISILNAKMDRILVLLEELRVSELDSINTKLDAGIKQQSESDGLIMWQMRKLKELLKELDNDKISRQKKDFEQLQELMKLILANELIKPMEYEFR